LTCPKTGEMSRATSCITNAVRLAVATSPPARRFVVRTPPRPSMVGSPVAPSAPQRAKRHINMHALIDNPPRRVRLCPSQPPVVVDAFTLDG
jgi:hypothetical protein